MHERTVLSEIKWIRVDNFDPPSFFPLVFDVPANLWSGRREPFVFSGLRVHINALKREEWLVFFFAFLKVYPLLFFFLTLEDEDIFFKEREYNWFITWRWSWEFCYENFFKKSRGISLVWFKLCWNQWSCNLSS